MQPEPPPRVDYRLPRHTALAVASLVVTVLATSAYAVAAYHSGRLAHHLSTSSSNAFGSVSSLRGARRADSAVKTTAAIYAIAILVNVAVAGSLLVRIQHRLALIGLEFRLPASAGVWAWLVPLANAVLPFRLVSDLWNATSPTAEPSARRPWKDRRIDALVGAWWALVVGTAIGQAVIRATFSNHNLTDLSHRDTSLGVLLGFLAIGFGLGLVILVELVRRFRRRMDPQWLVLRRPGSASLRLPTVVAVAVVVLLSGWSAAFATHGIRTAPGAAASRATSPSPRSPGGTPAPARHRARVPALPVRSLGSLPFQPRGYHLLSPQPAAFPLHFDARALANLAGRKRTIPKETFRSLIVSNGYVGGRARTYTDGRGHIVIELFIRWSSSSSADGFGAGLLASPKGRRVALHRAPSVVGRRFVDNKAREVAASFLRDPRTNVLVVSAAPDLPDIGAVRQVIASVLSRH